ncbi:hypothetical protein H0G86_002685 [Trichoderma simmonsii]|uniref:Uncharacterized protein n=1 Tax=Trichoderma simmonsii TaxID=1491479 RepID=A0A8G0L407_9HYPO|nr:hypothetical protein H0G86_002685 [Trichoderma simmonsii]
MGKDETVKVETQKLLLKTFDNQPLDNIRCFLPTVSILVLLHLSPPYSFAHPPNFKLPNSLISQSPASYSFLLLPRESCALLLFLVSNSPQAPHAPRPGPPASKGQKEKKKNLAFLPRKVRACCRQHAEFGICIHTIQDAGIEPKMDISSIVYEGHRGRLAK